MKSTITTTPMSNAISSSLLARNVYSVCFLPRDGLDFLHGELAQAREGFFAGGRKPVRVGKKEGIRGFSGRLQGKLGRSGCFWRKTVRPAGAKTLALEEAFDQRGGYLVVTRDFQGVIKSRMFFDREHLWLKSEYYEPWDSRAAQVIFKPVASDDSIERFDWDPARKRYQSTILSPVPYKEGTAEQSLENARFGEPQLLVSTQEGVFCYCPQEEAQARREAAAQLEGGTVMLLPAWEVREGSLGPEEDEAPGIAFTSLEEYARLEPPAEKPEAASAGEKEPDGDETPKEESPAEEKEPSEDEAPKEEAPKEETASAGEKEPSEDEAPKEEAAPAGEEKPREGEPQDPEDREILKRARAAAQQAPATLPAEEGSGLVRTQRPGGATAYEGEFRNGKREGFGSYYYKDGSLCYAGFWKEDKKDGLGVSFRERDHVLHISRWKEGAPGEFVSLFDQAGNLRYGGRMENGKKQGAGVSYDQDAGTVFVGKWLDGQPTGVGSAFDREGNLVYYGGWDQGKPNGRGTEFDSSGAIVFDGEWKDGKYYNGVLYQKPEGDAPEEPGAPLWEP